MRSTAEVGTQTTTVKRGLQRAQTGSVGRSDADSVRGRPGDSENRQEDQRPEEQNKPEGKKGLQMARRQRTADDTADEEEPGALPSMGQIEA